MSGWRDPSHGCERVYIGWQADKRSECQFCHEPCGASESIADKGAQSQCHATLIVTVTTRPNNTSSTSPRSACTGGSPAKNLSIEIRSSNVKFLDTASGNIHET